MPGLAPQFRDGTPARSRDRDRGWQRWLPRARRPKRIRAQCRPHLRVNTMNLPASSPPWISTLLPMFVCSFGYPLHRPVYILPGNVGLTFADQIDDALVRFQVFAPDRGLLMTRRDAHTHERKKWQQYAPCMLQQKWISGGFA